MNWKDRYNNIKMTADDAVKLIKNGDTVVLGHAMAEPQELVESLSQNYQNYKDVEIVQMVPFTGELAKEKYEGHFIYNSLFAGGSTRKAVQNGFAEFTPVFWSVKLHLAMDLTI